MLLHSGLGSQIANGGDANAFSLGSSIASSGFMNNRQLHVKEAELIRENAKAFAEEQGITEEAIAILTSAALSNVSDDPIAGHINPELEEKANNFFNRLVIDNPEIASSMAEDGQTPFYAIGLQRDNSNQNISHWDQTKDLYQKLVKLDYASETELQQTLDNATYELFIKRQDQELIINEQYDGNGLAHWHDARAVLDINADRFENGDIGHGEMRNVLLDFSLFTDHNNYASDELKQVLDNYTTIIALFAASGNRGALNLFLKNFRSKTANLINFIPS